MSMFYAILQSSRITEIFNNKLWLSDFCRTVSLEGLICQLLIKNSYYYSADRIHSPQGQRVEVPSDYYTSPEIFLRPPSFSSS